MNQSEGARGEVVFAGKLLTVRREPVHHADGSVSLYEIVDHPDAIAVVALRQAESRDRGESSQPDSTWLVALVRQLRPAIGKETLELPAGLVRGRRERPPGTNRRARARRGDRLESG